MAQLLANMPNGTRVKDITSSFLGTPVIFRKANTNHPGYPANTVTLITDQVIRLGGFDASEPGNTNASRRDWGNNRYMSSNLRQYLNSMGNANTWWAAQNPGDGTPGTNNADARPSTAGMANHNGYDTDPGFMTHFSQNFRNAIVATPLPGVVRNTVTDGGGVDSGLVDNFFLASNTEVGLANESGVAEGTVFPIFTDNGSRIATHSPQSAANYTGGAAANAAQWWWLRTPNAGGSVSARGVDASGSLNGNSACSGLRGVRPLCNLQSSILVSDNADTDGAFIIQWVQPPTMPGTLNVPGTIVGGSSPTISWTASTDPNVPAQTVSYILERSTNGGAFARINAATPFALSFVDSVAVGTTSVQYRVRATNSTVDSANNTGSVITVVNNSPPSIDGADGSLGVQTGAFAQNYVVTDPDVGDTITVIERLNGVQIRSYTATSGAAQSLTITPEMFAAIGSGTQTLTVTASDQFNATVVRTWTFTRDSAQTSQIQVQRNIPFLADAQPNRVLLSVQRSIPSGASFQVMVCNNGNDASPTWEDCTNSVLLGIAYTFTNTTKTAADWGVNVQVNVQRNSAVGACWIGTIGGNFD